MADGEMRLNAVGEMVKKEWGNISERFVNIALDQFVVMPNHLHGIIVINESNVGADLVSARKQRSVAEGGKRAGTSPAPTNRKPNLGGIMRAFKSISTNQYIAGVHDLRWKPFDRKVWQRNYYDRVIRDAEELQIIREYIVANPLMWAEDEENPRKE